MSSGVQVAVLEPRGLRGRRTSVRPAGEERPILRISVFAILALYGALRWGTMLSPSPVWRMFGLLAVAVVIVGPVRAVATRSRTVAILLSILAGVALLPLAGMPVTWITHLRVAVVANAIAAGLSALPRVTVPYSGINESARMVIVLGAGVLLLDAALLMAFAPRRVDDLRRAAAALPLVVLAVVPSTLARPGLAYLHGLILFGLLAAFIWGERVSRYDVPLTVLVAALAAAAAMIAAPALDRHKPWLNYEALAGTLAPAHVEAFDWSQRYGPLNWPRTGREVLDVRAHTADYWKAEDLDLFNGTGWTQGYVQPDSQVPAPDPAALARWTQQIEVTIRAMRTSDVIAAGFAQTPTHSPSTVVSGQSAGTWKSVSELAPGDSYTVSTYSPSPTPAQLTRAGAETDPQPMAGYRSLLLPTVSGPVLAAPEITFPPFHSALPVRSVIGIDAVAGTELIRASPYRRAYVLATDLARHAATPYGFAQSVLHFLARGYSYRENPPVSQYPLQSFLFKDRIGYCQQFSGAMALLLRMGGVPARVAAGFTTGGYDSTTHQWIVSDQDAHSWVEAWFPHYGWVRFDPTPAAAPARGGRVLLPALHGTLGASKAATPVNRPGPAAGPVRSRVGRHSGASPWALIAAIALFTGLVLTLLLLAVFRAPELSSEAVLAELERAMARCRRPIAPGQTLTALERRFGASSDAAAYIRAIRMARFAGATELPTPAQRRALRAHLRADLGLGGLLRALWALPPRLGVRRAPRSPSPGA